MEAVDQQMENDELQDMHWAHAAAISLQREVKRRAAIQIQRAWRVHKIVQSAITIQAAVRGRQAGHSFPIQRNAVSTLQRSARFMLTRTR